MSELGQGGQYLHLTYKAEDDTRGVIFEFLVICEEHSREKSLLVQVGVTQVGRGWGGAHLFGHHRHFCFRVTAFTTSGHNVRAHLRSSLEMHCEASCVAVRETDLFSLGHTSKNRGQNLFPFHKFYDILTLAYKNGHSHRALKMKYKITSDASVLSLLKKNYYEHFYPRRKLLSAIIRQIV